MNILIATSEAVPFAKTGGLADVCGALPIELARLGHQPTLILPAYRQTHYCGQPIESLGIDFIVPIGSKMVTGHLLKSTMPGTQTPVYLIQQDQYFDRDQLYNVDGKDYIDNCERFVFFSRAVLEAIRLLDLQVDVIHANDWQTGLVPAYLEIEYRKRPRYQNIASLFTIHNLAFQGQFWHWDMLLTGLDWKYFNWHQMEFHGHLNLLKTGLVFADSISTVSPRYAMEIQSSPLGCGLEGVLQVPPRRAFGHSQRHRSGGMESGDRSAPFRPLRRGKLPPRQADLQGGVAARTRTAARSRACRLIGMIGRLTEQKGFDLVVEVMQRWVQTNDAQWAILGTGQPKFQKALESLAQRFPQKVAVRMEYSNPLAHRIEAGADIFLMPSRYEPCGLSQLYSLRYGTVPVVRATGGLADTIVGYDEQTAAAGAANGFSFQEYSSLALGETLRQACDVYRQPEAWDRLIATGMKQDWSWTRSAKQYVELYQSTLARKKST